MTNAALAKSLVEAFGQLQLHGAAVVVLQIFLSDAGGASLSINTGENYGLLAGVKAGDVDMSSVVGGGSVVLAKGDHNAAGAGPSASATITRPAA